MRSKEEVVRAFIETDPAPKEFSISSDPTLLQRMEEYKRARLALEVQLDVRDLLVEFVRLAKEVD